MARSCGTCTKCCEGWLSGDIRGHKMYPGKPCFFVEIGKGCKDYENRPKNPCREFECLWLKNLDVPEEFSPEKTGVIITWQTTEEGIEYLLLTRAPSSPSAEMLSWAAVAAVVNRLNLSWQIGEKTYWFGNPEFSDYMQRKTEEESKNQDLKKLSILYGDKNEL